MTTTSYKILPNVNYFLSDRFSLGLGLGYNGSSNTNVVDNRDPLGTQKHVNLKGSTNSFIVSPNIKFFFPLGERAYIYLVTSMNYTQGSIKQLKYSNMLYYSNGQTIETEEAQGSSKSIAAGIKPGFLFFPAKNWGVQLSLGNNLLGYSMRYESNIYNYNYHAYSVPDQKVTYEEWQLFSLSSVGLSTSINYYIRPKQVEQPTELK